MMEIKRGEAVFYRARGGVVRATVKTLHKDGSVSVRAHFFVDEDGKDKLGHLGVCGKPHDPLYSTCPECAETPNIA